MPREILFGLTPETTIRDSLYDLIPLPREAALLLETPAFLRLDGIQQLGFVSRIWPGARHTRFEHSLGVMHLMREALAHLRFLEEQDCLERRLKSGIVNYFLVDPVFEFKNIERG